MSNKKHQLVGFGKTGEKVEERNEAYFLSGKGTDLGCVLLVREEIKNPSLLEIEVKGKVFKEKPWTRLRIEVFDKSSQDAPSTSFEEEYLMEGLTEEKFTSLSFPILGIVKHPYKVQVMVVGPSQSELEIRNVHLR